MYVKLRKTVTLYLVIQVLYLTQIYPYAHFHAHTDSHGLHIDFVSHLVTGQGDPETGLLIPHQHELPCHSDDEGTNEVPANHHDTVDDFGGSHSNSLEHCDFHGYHHSFSSTFQLPTIHNHFAVQTQIVVVASEEYEDHGKSLLTFDRDERGPPDDILVTLRSPRPPPVLA